MYSFLTFLIIIPGKVIFNILSSENTLLLSLSLALVSCFALYIRSILSNRDITKPVYFALQFVLSFVISYSFYLIGPLGIVSIVHGKLAGIFGVKGISLRFLNFYPVGGPINLSMDNAGASEIGSTGQASANGSTGQTSASGDTLDDPLTNARAKILGNLFETRVNEILEQRRSLTNNRQLLNANVHLRDIGFSFEDHVRNRGELSVEQVKESFLIQRKMFNQFIIDNKDKYPKAFNKLSQMDLVPVWTKEDQFSLIQDIKNYKNN